MGMTVKMTISPEAHRIRAQYELVAKNHESAFAKALVVECKRVLKLSQDIYVPVVTGTLRASGYVEGPTPTDKGYIVMIGYGKDVEGKPVNYALRVHEMPKKFGQHKNKYLSTPAYIEAEKLPIKMQMAMQSILSAGGLTE